MKLPRAAARFWSRWRLFVLCIAVPRMLSPNFGHRLSTQFTVEVLGATRTNLGMLDSVRHWVGLVSNPLGGWIARSKGIKWLLALHTAWLICSNLWTANTYEWEMLLWARGLSGLQESFDELALGYFFITQLGPEQRAWGAVALAFVLRLHATVGPLLGAAILSQLDNPEDPENYRTVLWIEAACRTVPLCFILFFVPGGLGVVATQDGQHDAAAAAAAGSSASAADWWAERGQSRLRRRCLRRSSWARTFAHSGRSLCACAAWSTLIFIANRCWSRYAVPLRASELGISKLTLQFSQSVEEAVAIPTQLLFGWLLRRYTMAFKTVGLINGVLWGLGLLALGLWVREEDSARFYWTHAIWGVGYGAYIVNDVAKATMAPPAEHGAAEWLAMLHTAKDIAYIGIPPAMGAYADAASVSALACVCAVAAVLAGVFFFAWVPRGRIDGSQLQGGGRRSRALAAVPKGGREGRGASVYSGAGGSDDDEEGALLGKQKEGDSSVRR